MIVVLDDDAVARRLMVRVLARGGYTAHEVSTGQEALDALEGQQDALLITDMLMPGMSGAQLCEHLFARHDSARVLLVSGLGAEDFMELCAHPRIAFLGKPFRPDHLVHAVRALLEV